MRFGLPLKSLFKRYKTLLKSDKIGLLHFKKLKLLIFYQNKVFITFKVLINVFL